MRYALLLVTLLACANDPYDPCNTVDEGMIAECEVEGEVPICDEQVNCSYNADGVVTGRTYTQSLCRGGEPNCEYVCYRPDSAPCSNPFEG